MTISSSENHEPADTLRLLCAATQELLARASLSNERDGRENVQLLRMAEKLIKGATAVLEAQPVPRSASALALLQAQLRPTFIGSLLPWLVDALCLYSAFAFDFSQRLLPLVLPLLQQLQRLLSCHPDDPSLRRFETANARAQFAQPVPITSAHPYKPAGVPASSKKAKDRAPKPPIRREEKHEWPGASQLLLTFDRRCCTEEGDWLVLHFFKERGERPVRSVRLGGLWQHWPRQLLVQADSLHAIFQHGAESLSTIASAPGENGAGARSPSSADMFGYHFTVTASKRWTADRNDTPPLVQLRTSLFYLGTKCACLLCFAEPVEREESQQAHWLHSPLLSRGLPLQLDSKHPLMHPFFGLGNVPTSDAEARRRDAAFLNDLTESVTRRI